MLTINVNGEIAKKTLIGAGLGHVVDNSESENELLESVQSLRGYKCYRLNIDLGLVEETLKIIKREVREHEDEANHKTMRIMAAESALELIETIETHMMQVWQGVENSKTELENETDDPCEVCGEPYWVLVGDDEVRGCTC